MILRSHTVAGHIFEFRPPSTARDVLDWTLWIQCMEGDTLETTLQEQATAALQWACQWLAGGLDWQGLSVLIGELTEPAEYIGAVVELCQAIAASAGLPDTVLDGIAGLLDKQNDIPQGWKPESICTCVKCRKGTDNPRGMSCLYDEFDQRAVVAIARVAGVTDTGEPYYVAQVRAALSHAEGRRMAHERQKREEQAEYDDIMKRKGLRRG